MTLEEQIADMLTNKKKKFTFSLECGRGETYSHNSPVMYAHSTYERSSVLAGRPQRIWVESWDNWEAARTEIEKLKKKFGKKFKIEDNNGNSYIPTSVLVSHLPDDTDY